MRSWGRGSTGLGVGVGLDLPSQSLRRFPAQDRPWGRVRL